METLNITSEQIKKAEQKFNRLQNRFYTAISKMEEALEELPQKGNTARDCQKILIIDKIKELECALNGLCVEDFITESE